MRIGSREDAQSVGEVHASFSAIPGVRCAVAARRTVPTEGTFDFTHLSIIEFADRAARLAYHDHPLHLAAHERARSWAAEVVVLDIG